MAEGVGGYPRWSGALRTGPVFPVIAYEEVRRHRYNQWFQSVLLVLAIWSLFYIGSTWTQVRGLDETSHSLDQYLQFLNLLPWGAIAVAAVVSGPSLLEDAKNGALELYLSRAVTRPQYLAGKITAVVGISFAAIFIPAALYWTASWVMFDVHPEGWGWVIFKVAAYALMWALLVGGLGMALSCLSRSSVAASLLLFGGFFAVHVLVANLLSFITGDANMQVISPFAMLEQQTSWIFGVDAPHEFPHWWGLVAWGGLAAVSWIVVAIRHPRLRGA